MSGPFFLPRVTYDYNTIKPGLYFFDGDYINKLQVLGGISYNSDKDLDFFLLFDNNQYRSSYFFNFYWMSRNIKRSHPYINATGQVIPSINYNVNYSYQLFSTDIGNRFIIKDHNTWRYQLDISNHWQLSLFKKNVGVFTNNFKYFHLSNDDADDFLYFFGGGLPGNKAYTFYEPVLQGPKQFIISNTVTFPIITEKSIKINHFYLNSLSIGFSHQIGKSFNGKIMVNNMGYDIDEIDENGLLLDFQNIQEYLDLSNSIDGLDNNDIIIDDLEPYLYPDIYAEHNDNNFTENGKSIKDLKERYNAYKQSIGIEMKILGFSF